MIPEYTVTSCANQGVTLTMSARTSEVIEELLVRASGDRDLWPADTALLRNIAVDLTRMRILNAAVSPKSI